MKSFKHITPESRIFCGPDSLKQLPKELKRDKCERVLIFCDPFLKEEGTLLSMVEEVVGDRLVDRFYGICPGSPVPEVKKGAELIKKTNADAIVVIGGGSASVTARAAIIVACEGKGPHEICTHRDKDGKLVSPKLLAKKIPMYVVPTTPITAMVKAGASILDSESDTLLAMFDPKTRGRSIFIHPQFVESMPEGLLMSACMSTMAAAIDGLLSTDGDIISDALLIQSLRTMAESLADKESLDDPQVRCELLMATVLCGMGSDYTGFGISVVLGHAITAYNRINAGLVNGVLIPHALKYNKEAETGMKKVAQALSIDTQQPGYADAVCRRVDDILGALNVPHTLKEMNMDHEKLDEIAEAAMDDWYLHFNPIPVDHADVIKIIEDAWE